ncbi:TIM barrel protein [Rhizobium sp. BK376]|uniref:sugar phosphate isomerase/epimerase family protein n=1 Tax=Rhizobium sp. BK376 TaxID=2512149 RepID=UPI001052D206|nr:TIM barrel protein [Rhizobium sp. BK376]TCR91721.1 sugar phosphate isomerase/epimerase [Rhizobium sp. BK376]
MTDNSKTDRFAVSTWSLHRALGVTYPYRPGEEREPERRPTYGEGSVDLIDLPVALRDHGLSRLEICSFHLPTLSASYLAELSDAFVQAGVRVQTLLVEDGDLSNPETAARDAEWIASWIPIASALKAENMRVIAGKAQPTEEALARAEGHLRWLAQQAEGSGIRIVTENWFALLPGAREVNRLLGALDGKVGLNGDFGNWTGPGKYDELAQIMGKAELCHAKAHYGAGGMDAEDYRRCVELSEAAGYRGPYTLIYDSDFHPNEWNGIVEERDFIGKILG